MILFTHEKSPTDGVIKIYRKSVEQFTALLNEAIEQQKNRDENDAVGRANDQKLIDRCRYEIEHHQAHVDRLENNHANCIEPCCPACTQGGLKNAKIH